MSAIKDTPAANIAAADQAWFNSVTKILKARVTSVVINNNAATAYVVPDNTGFVRFTGTQAAAIEFTLPSASADIDGLMITFSSVATSATLTWVSSGATFSGAPAAFAANTPFNLKYVHATTSWERA